MHKSINFSTLPSDLQDWQGLVSDFPYDINGNDLVPQQALSAKAYLLLWGAQLNTQTLQNFCLNLQAFEGQFQLHACYRELGLPTVLLCSDACPTRLRSQLSEQAWPFDVVALPSLPNLNAPGLVLMDMDSTTIEIECIDEIAALAGVGEQVKAVTAAAMRGELDFEQSLRQRVALLAGQPVSVLDAVADNMPLMEGLLELIACLKQAKWKVAIASGGFTHFAERLQRDLGFDAVFANRLAEHEGHLTGEVLGEVVDAKRKQHVLEQLKAQYGFEQSMAIGDGANDLLMLNAANFGVAIHAKPVVEQQAQMAIKHSSLDGVVRILRAAQHLA